VRRVEGLVSSYVKRGSGRHWRKIPKEPAFARLIAIVLHIPEKHLLIAIAM